MASPSPAAKSPLTPTHWLILIIASIGFAFDIYELLVLPLILRPAITELAGAAPGSPEFRWWAGLLFYVPAFAGGLFGLVGGYLTDLLGRRRVLTWSILLYAVSAFLAGYSTSMGMLLFLRCTTFVGVCIEFVAAVAWLAELFPDPHQRERALGYTQAFSSIGGLLVAVANGLAIEFASSLPSIQIPEFASFMGTIAAEHQHEGWRYTLMSGLIPAIPLILIRPFLPESPVWQEKKAAGTLKRPSLLEIFAPQFRRTTIVTTIMFACSYGAAFGAIQQIPQIVPGLEDVKEHAKEEGKGQPVPKQKAIEKAIEQKTASNYTKVQEIGGLMGRFLLAMMAARIVSRRGLLRCFQLPGLVIVPLVFFLFLKVQNREFFVLNLSALKLGVLPFTTVSLGVLIAGLFTVAQFSFWGNYLPRVYPVHLRGTGESFAANIGGRMIGTSFAALTTYVAGLPSTPGDSDPAKMAITAAGVALLVYVVGSIACFWLPEPQEATMAE